MDSDSDSGVDMTEYNLSNEGEANKNKVKLMIIMSASPNHWPPTSIMCGMS